jgi:hypothetical protein
VHAANSRQYETQWVGEGIAHELQKIVGRFCEKHI